MKRSVEFDLIEELLRLSAERKAFLDDSVEQADVNKYIDQARFDLEQRDIFGLSEQIVAHSSELPESGSFIRRSVAGLPLLITRSETMDVHIFLNVCRHRGTRLVDERQGCKKRFSCPYHAWTWNNVGDLLGVPHQQQGFPELNKQDYALKRLGVVEKDGWIWINPSSEQSPDVDSSLGELADDFAWLQGQEHILVHSSEMLCDANWKILTEGGLEAYHFKVAHRDTIAPHFMDNLSTYKAFGDHIRSVLAKKSLADLSELPKEQWRLRDHAQILYTMLPNSALLVQSDHIAWIHFQPLSAEQTKIRISTLVPKDMVPKDNANETDHWRKNHDITVATLKEDFDIGASIQSGLSSGANSQLTFGRFEGALAKFNALVDSKINT